VQGQSPAYQPTIAIDETLAHRRWPWWGGDGAEAGGAPQDFTMSASGSLGGSCPMGYGTDPKARRQDREGPADTPDRALDVGALGNEPPAASIAANHPGEAVPLTSIPATGRGNSDDGQRWLNPSPYQLHRALKRKGKPIAKEDAYDVSEIHDMVVNGSWDAVMQFEQMHADMCPDPKLARFEGQDGNYSIKARFMNFFGVNLPFDRHDWTVDRCGKEVRYCIDYYDTEDSYWIDARPMGLEGVPDRVRHAFSRLINGESPW